VTVEAVTLVLRQNDDLQVAGVCEVGQHEVDDSIAATERHGWLGPVGCQRRETPALPARQYHHEDLGLSHVAER
jgi:hypothetical protein